MILVDINVNFLTKVFTNNSNLFRKEKISSLVSVVVSLTIRSFNSDNEEFWYEMDILSPYQ